MAGEGVTMGATTERLIEVMGELDRLVNWERRDRTADMGRTLEPVQDLLRRLGDPHRGPRFVHVAGTKGKGSVSAIVAAALSAEGIRCGCYASPHVERVTERVCVDGVEEDEAALSAGLEAALSAREQAIVEKTPAQGATWFDLFTAAALRVFYEAACEWVVLECGLGGRLDSTNAVDGDVCVLTNVDLEHTSVLGDTLRAIALEKSEITPAEGVLVGAVGGHVQGEPDASFLSGKERARAECYAAVGTLERVSGGVFHRHASRGLNRDLERRGQRLP